MSMVCSTEQSVRAECNRRSVNIQCNRKSQHGLERHHGTPKFTEMPLAGSHGFILDAAVLQRYSMRIRTGEKGMQNPFLAA